MGGLWKDLAILAFLMMLVSCSKSGNGGGSDLLGIDTENIEEGRDEASVDEEDLDAGGDAGPVCSRVNLIVNGSFEEEHELSKENNWRVASVIPGWQLDLVAADAPFELQFGDTGGIKAKRGKIKLELDSHNKDGFTESDARVFQEVATVKDQVYHLKFFYAARVSRSSAMEVYWNDEKVLSVDGVKQEWMRIKTKLVGIDGLSKLEFRAPKDSDTVGALLDGVSLKTKVCID